MCGFDSYSKEDVFSSLSITKLEISTASTMQVDLNVVTVGINISQKLVKLIATLDYSFMHFFVKDLACHFEAIH